MSAHYGDADEQQRDVLGFPANKASVEAKARRRQENGGLSVIHFATMPSVQYILGKRSLFITPLL